MNEALLCAGGHGVGRMTHIERETSLAGDNVDGAGFCFDLANGGDEAGLSEGRALDGNDPFRGGGNGIAAKMHWRGAGVIGAAHKCKFDARLCGDGFDGRERKSDTIRGPVLARCEIPSRRARLR